MISFPGKSWTGPLPPLTAEERALEAELRAGVERLAGDIGPRNTERPEALARARDWIEEELRAAGLEPERETYSAGGIECANVLAELRGTDRPGEVVVVGAHYDTCVGTPGANDNSSGVAALLCIARRLPARRPARTVRFAAFVNEEPPWFATERMGSAVHVARARERGDRIAAMVSLETIGYYADEPGSQHYPFPFSMVYPSRGDFLGFVGAWSSRKLIARCVGTFREHARLPSEAAAPPGWIEGVLWSDHLPFEKAGWPALMVTDTAPFRYPWYHAPGDTPDRLDYPRMARAVAGLLEVVAGLGGAES